MINRRLLLNLMAAIPASATYGVSQAHAKMSKTPERAAPAGPAFNVKDLPHGQIGAMTLVEMTAAYRAKTLSPVEVSRAIIERIHASQSALNAFFYIDEGGAYAAAAASEARWSKGEPLSALDGVPTSVKDHYNVANWPRYEGSANFFGKPFDTEDAPTVATLRAAGAIMIGKTGQCDDGWLVNSASSAYGNIHNPWRLGYSAGASSSGAGAAAAAGLGPLHMGSDGGGSIRTPSAYNGVVGWKPTGLRIPNAGSPDGFGVFGPLTRSVDDAYIVGQVLAEPKLSAMPRLDPSQMRIAYMPYYGDGLEPTAEVLAACEAAVAVLTDAGFTVETVDGPLRPGLSREAAALPFYEEASGYLEIHGRDNLDKLEPIRRQNLITASNMAPELLKRSKKSRQEAERLLAEHPVLHYDAVIEVSAPTATYPIANNWPLEAEGRTEHELWLKEIGLTLEEQLSNIAHGLLLAASVNIPGGLNENGLPVGIQIASAAGQDETAFAVAKFIHETMKPPTLV